MSETVDEAVARLGLPQRPPDYAGRMPLLNERQTTHGDYTVDASIAISTIELWQGCPGWQKLPPFAKHALTLIAVKVARILAGKWNTKDHWVDIAGYANLVAERCEENK